MTKDKPIPAMIEKYTFFVIRIKITAVMKPEPAIGPNFSWLMTYTPPPNTDVE
jgi:hypothetical protein